jgi:hypothetical protein
MSCAIASDLLAVSHLPQADDDLTLLGKGIVSPMTMRSQLLPLWRRLMASLPEGEAADEEATNTL